MSKKLLSELQQVAAIILIDLQAQDAITESKTFEQVGNRKMHKSCMKDFAYWCKQHQAVVDGSISTLSQLNPIIAEQMGDKLPVVVDADYLSPDQALAELTLSLPN